MLDYDGDGWPDLFVANDTQPNKLYRNNGNGTFTEKGVAAGVAFSEDGVARGAMGVDAADYDRSGRPHLLVGNFPNQMLALYRNEGNGLFVDEAPSVHGGPRQPAVARLRRLLLRLRPRRPARHLRRQRPHRGERSRRVQPKVQFKQTPLLFRNRARDASTASAASLGAAFNVPQVGRGAAYGDYDRDGDLDVLLINNHGPARLLRNDGGNRNHWLTIRTRRRRRRTATASAPSSASRQPSGTQWQIVHSGSSYCSQSDLALTFGLGNDTT